MENCEQGELVDVADESLDEAGRARRDKADCSHRVIEKRRRDRINNSLMQLSKLVPFEQFNKKNSGKLEKAEILEVTVQYLMQQQQQQQKQQQQKKMDTAEISCQHVEMCKNGQDNKEKESTDFLKGFKNCIDNATKFFVEVEELDVSEGRCNRLVQHLKKQVSLYEKNDFVPLEDLQEVCENTHNGTSNSLDQDIPVVLQSSTRVKVENTKRKNDEQAETGANKRLNTSVTPVGGDVPISPEQDTASINEATESTADQMNRMRNFMPYFLPNMPFLPTMCAGANGMLQCQPSPQTQFPGYPFLQSGTPYIPVTLPQLPYIGLNFVSGFGMMNAGGANQPQNNRLPGNNMVNGFVPSMYSNGSHTNLLTMRHHDSGYDSSDKSSSKGGHSQNSPQSCSDDSYSS